MTQQDGFEFRSEPDAELDPDQAETFKEAVLHSADWTVETVLSQLTRGNIDLNPRFQRRDAWGVKRKSTFIESLILGLPVPQIVLAEKRGQRGKYIVLDGKQRLLTLLQFTGNAADGEHNGFRLSGLEARSDLKRRSFDDLRNLEADINTLLNYTIRTVVIRNWPSYEFLHIVFLRLNTGSVKLSPQELRQALLPGPFTDWADDRAAESQALLTLLAKESPDARMRDVELLVRFLGFRFFLRDYAGRMKTFLDSSCNSFNSDWNHFGPLVEAATVEFEGASTALIDIFGADEVARKEGSKSFNRAIFDALAFYASDQAIRTAMLNDPGAVRAAYANVMADDEFLEAVESDTAGVPHTLARLQKWGTALLDTLAIQFNVPQSRPANPGQGAARAGISFDGFR